MDLARAVEHVGPDKHQPVIIQRADEVVGQVHPGREAHDRGGTRGEAVDCIYLVVAISSGTGGGKIAKDAAGARRNGAGLQSIEIIGAHRPIGKRTGDPAGAVAGIHKAHRSGQDVGRASRRRARAFAEACGGVAGAGGHAMPEVARNLGDHISAAVSDAQGVRASSDVGGKKERSPI